MTSFAAIDADVWTCSGEKKFIVLNARWLVLLTDPNQWIIEVRKGRPNSKGSGWRGSSYCTQQTTFLREAVADDISSQDSRKPSLDALFGHWPLPDARRKRKSMRETGVSP